MDYSGISVTKEIENQIKQQQPFVPSDYWEKAVGNRNFGHAENSSLAGWNNITFVNLMAMAEKGVPYTQINSNRAVESSSSAVPNAPENEDIDLNATPALPKKRRKKHRPKVVIEGKPKRTPKPKTPEVGENKSVKRKYVRKKGVQVNENPLVGPKDNADPTWEPVPKRILDFDVESEARDMNHPAALDHQKGVQSCDVETSHGSSGTIISSSVQNKTIQQPKSTQGQGVIVDNKPSRVQSDLYLFSDECLSFQESQEQRQEDSRSITVAERANAFLDKEDSPQWRGKKKRTEKGPSTVTPGTSRTRSKSKGWGQSFYQNSSNFASLLKDVQSSSSFQINNITGTNVVGRQFGNLPSSPLMMNFGQIGNRKHSTNTSTRCHSVASLTAIMESKQFPSTPPKAESNKGRKRRNDVYSGVSLVLALDNHAMITKKRTKRVAHKVDSASSSYTDQVYVYEHEIALFDSQYYQSFTKSRGSQNVIKLDDIPSLDQLVQKMYSISIASESTPAIMQEYNNAIIPFVRTPAIMQRRNAIVPFDGVQGSNSESLVIVEPKKRKLHAKVDLDPETDIKWKQLMGKECDQGVGGTDVDKEKWWEKERRVFRERADSFIARMHLIQGNMRFTKWKGSVVDSVIGVFLTQNVTDHLSSSAFMSLASRFPLQSTSNPMTCYEDRTEVFIEEPDEPEQCHENLSAEPVRDQGSITFQEIENVEDREYYSLGSNIPSSTLLNELKGKQIDVHQSESDSVAKSSIKFQHLVEREYTRTEEDAFSSRSSICSSIIHNAEQIVAMDRTNACLADSKDSTAVGDIVSSQNSVISSQTSESSVIQTAELIGSCSGSNSEAEDVVIACEPNSSDATGPWAQLLRMDNTKRLQVCFSDRPDAPTDSYLPTSNSNPSVPESESTLSSNYPLHMTPVLREPEAESLKAPGQEITDQDSSSKVNSPEIAKNGNEILNDSPPSAQGPPPVQSSYSCFRQESNLEKHSQCCTDIQAERSEALQPGNTQLVEPLDPVETLLLTRNSKTQQASSSLPENPNKNSDVEKATHLMASQTLIQSKGIESNLNGHIHSSEKSLSETIITASLDTPKAKRNPDKAK